MQKFFPNVTLTPAILEPQRKGNVSVVSDVEGADIYIDAKFVGNAPATSAPPSGPHKIEVRDQTAGRGNGTLKCLKIVMSTLASNSEEMTPLKDPDGS